MSNEETESRKDKMTYKYKQMGNDLDFCLVSTSLSGFLR